MVSGHGDNQDTKKSTDSVLHQDPSHKLTGSFNLQFNVSNPCKFPLSDISMIVLI